VVQPNGKKSWAWRYRWHGRPSKLTFSKSYPEMSLGAARAEANAAIRQLESGQDPLAAKTDEQRGERTNSVRQAAREWIEYAKPDMRTWRDAERKLAKDVFPEWERKLMKDIGPHDVKKLHHEVSKRGPIAANRLFETLRNWFNWCVDEEILDVSPMEEIDYKRLRNEERSRDRVLSDTELALVWRASEKLGYPQAPFRHALILTGQRRGEVAGMRWDEIDLQAGVWNSPGSRTKNRKPHMVPLGTAMLDLLKKLPRFTGPHVFTTTSGAMPINGFSKAKEKLDSVISGLLAEADDATPMADWSEHDIRRTVATGMAQMGVPPHVLAAILNHSQRSVQGISAIYNRFEYLAERRKALEDWGRHVLGLEKELARRKSA
jgi:integrase